MPDRNKKEDLPHRRRKKETDSRSARHARTSEGDAPSASAYSRARYPVRRRKKATRVVPLVIIAAVCLLGIAFVISPWGLDLFPHNDATDDDASSTSSPSSDSLFDQSSFSLVGDAEMTLTAGSVYEEPGTTLDDADVAFDGSVDTAQEGDYTLTYTHGLKTLTRTVTVVDGRQIVMNLNGSKDTIVKVGQPYIESGCHAIAADGTNLTDAVETSGAVDTAVLGTYDVSYRVSNDQGVTCVKKRSVHVVAEPDFVANTTGVPVLMYHYVYTAQTPPADQTYINNYILDTSLEAQLQYLVNSGYYYPSYQELNAYAQGLIDLPEKSIVLTFDDGEQGFLTYGIPLLEKYGVPATSFIIASDGDAGSKINTYASEYVSFQSHSYSMHRAGGTIGHGGIISAMSKDEIVQDLQLAQSIVQNTEAFAYPFGDNTEAAHEAVREAGILCSFTTQYGRVQKGSDSAYLPRVRINGDISLESFIATVS